MSKALSASGAVPPPAGGRLEVGLASGGALRWVAAEITAPLEEARRRLDLSPIGAVALGRSLAGAALLQRISLKTPARLTLEILGDGPLGKVIAETDERGRMRGTVGNPRLPTPEDGRMRIAPLVGRGMLRVTREGRRGAYVSQVDLVSGELGDDLTHYLEQSEQIRSAVLLGVLPRPAGIAAAGGLVVEALPGAGEEVVARLEQNLRVLEGVSFQLDKGGAAALTAAVLEGLEPEAGGALPLEYRCRCSREKLLERLRPLATEDLPALVDGARECEAICAFCGARYVYPAEELIGPPPRGAP